MTERSCLQCKRSHRKCDKKKPCCTLCLEREKVCEYDTSRTLRFEPYQSPKSKTVHRTIPTIPVDNPISPVSPRLESSTKQHAIDAIFEVQNMYSCMPLFPKAHLQKIVDYIRAIETNTPFNGPVPLNDELALVYSMQAQTFKIFGQSSISKRFYEKGYSLLYNYMDTALHNFVVVATFLHLAFPLICDAEIERARFFLENVRSFLSLRLYGKGQPQLEQRERFLKQLYFLATNNLLVGEAHKLDAEPNSDLTCVVKSYMYSHCLSRQHHLQRMLESQSDEDARDWISPQLADDFGEYMNLIRDDLMRGMNKFHITIERMEVIAQNFQNMFNATQNGVVYVDVAIKRLQYLIVTQAARIQLLLREGKKQAAIPIADYVTELTSNPCFKYSTPIISAAVVVAANVHLELVNMDLLKRDANALSLLKSRYEIVATRYGPYIDTLERVIRKYGEHEHLEDLSASLTSIKTNGAMHTASPGSIHRPNLTHALSQAPIQQVMDTSAPESSPINGVDQFLQVYLTDLATCDDSIFLSFDSLNEM